MSSVPCSVSGCSKSVHRKAYCYGHYMKDWRYGTPTPQHEPRWVDLRGQRFGLLVVTGARRGQAWVCTCDCGETTLGLAGDLNRGSKFSCGNRRIHYRTDDAGYSSAHQRVRRDRGSIHNHECIDCGAQAGHWSYNHDDPNELLGTSGRSTQLVPYSLDPNHYSARCVPCHKQFDLGRHSIPA